MKSPKEDPADKAARLRERRTSEIEQQSAAEANAAGLSSDLASIYNFRGKNLSMFARGKAKK